MAEKGGKKGREKKNKGKRGRPPVAPIQFGGFDYHDETGNSVNAIKIDATYVDAAGTPRPVNVAPMPVGHYSQPDPLGLPSQVTNFSFQTKDANGAVVMVVSFEAHGSKKIESVSGRTTLRGRTEVEFHCC